MWIFPCYIVAKEVRDMRLNHIIDRLRMDCQELSVRYSEEYQKRYRKSLCFYCYLVMDEIGAQLCTLVDEEFTDFGEFRDLVRGILSDYTDPRLKNPSGEAYGYIREAEKAFLECLEVLEPDCESPHIPYCRYLTGGERETVVAKFREKWDYVPHKYWYPMDGQEVREDRLFLHTDHVEDYWVQTKGFWVCRKIMSTALEKAIFLAWTVGKRRSWWATAGWRRLIAPRILVGSSTSPMRKP